MFGERVSFRSYGSSFGDLLSRLVEYAADSPAGTIPAAGLVLFFPSGSVVTKMSLGIVFAQQSYCWLVA